MRISGIVNDSIVDGEGIRLVVFTQGCPHHCSGCHNPETWDFEKGYDITVDEIFKIYQENPLLDGITLSGGEPLMPNRYSELIELLTKVKNTGGNVWVYTGFYLEDLCNKEKDNDIFKELLSLIDVVVDGPFVEEKKDLSLKFRGSSNQSIKKQKKGELSWIKT